MPNPFGPLYTIDFLVLVVCAVVWFKAAIVEDVPPWLWAGASVFVYVFTWRWLGWGIVGCLFGQLCLIIAVAILRVWKESRKRR